MDVGRLPAVTFAHVNHRLRGAASDADEALVSGLPGSWGKAGVIVRTQQVDVAALAKSEGWNLEDAGRRVRYAFFAQVARETGAWVATAHTANDQAETLLLRLLRGTGIAGLAGIPPLRPLEVGVWLARPWLTITRAQVENYGACHRLEVRQDASNQDPSFLRNRIRRDLLPLLEKDYQPALVSLLGRLGEQCRETQALLDALATGLLGRAEKPRAGAMVVLDAAAVASTAPIVAREMFRQVWQREDWPLGEMGLEEWKRLLALAAEKDGAIDLPGVRAVRRGKVLQLSARNQT